MADAAVRAAKRAAEAQNVTEAERANAAEELDAAKNAAEGVRAIAAAKKAAAEKAAAEKAAAEKAAAEKAAAEKAAAEKFAANNAAAREAAAAMNSPLGDAVAKLIADRDAAAKAADADVILGKAVSTLFLRCFQACF
ncbi:hypothetical protein N7478_001977 [Penicillium angulare]|uniref:uncharacterized protein n=1 Tax=Penicillium angulare TaxID=116970 RepID=UPI0025406A84|nr:uncharacterized protein N7478_001977 [Penicillium angulare]KAJ5288947.1 hypothetical protein N7478_001977 [Penicillium angulare]